MSFSELIPGIDYPPGFLPHLKPPSVSHSTTTAGSSSAPPPPAFPANHTRQPISQVGAVIAFHQGMISGEYSGYGDRVPRKRSKPEVLDPSPIPAGKRCRGRPPVSGRKPKVASWLSATETLQAGTSNTPRSVQKREETRPMNPFVGNGNGHRHHASARVGTATRLGSFVVNPSLAPTFQAILNKHGDIAKNCPPRDGHMRTPVLEGICKIILDLEIKKLTEINDKCLYDYFSVLEHAERMNFDVHWLSQRLRGIYGAVKAIAEANKLTNDRTIRTERIESMQKDLQVRKVELEKLHAGIQEKECHLILETMEAEKITKRINDIKSRVQHFQRNSLVEGLL